MLIPPRDASTRGGVGGTKGNLMKAKYGQSILEYTVIIAAVVTALLAMQVYVQRSLQAQLKTIDKQAAPKQIQ